MCALRSPKSADVIIVVVMACRQRTTAHNQTHLISRTSIRLNRNIKTTLKSTDACCVRVYKHHPVNVHLIIITISRARETRCANDGRMSSKSSESIKLISSEGREMRVMRKGNQKLCDAARRCSKGINNLIITDVGDFRRVRCCAKGRMSNGDLRGSQSLWLFQTAACV